MSSLPPKGPKPVTWVWLVAILFVYTIGMVMLSFYSSYQGCH